MQKLSEADIIARIQQGKTFSAILEDGSLVIKIEDYVPYLCAAIHHGHQLRSELSAKCALTEEERLYEEDPHTGDVIASMPITLIAQDSRYEYDLNRPVEQCVYDIAWGKPVWKQALEPEELRLSQEKHQGYYRILQVLVSKLEGFFKACVIYDIHSYNYKRLELSNTPCFNLGTTQLDEKKWKSVINHFIEKLAKIKLPNVEVIAAKNEVFQGKGYLATFIKLNFTQTLVLPTEIKKVFMDENSGEVFPMVLNALKAGMKEAILYNAASFVRKYTSKRIVRRHDLLASKSDPKLIKLDRELFKTAKGIDTLLYINPINLNNEKKRFFAKNFDYTPNFKYRQLKVDPYLFREQLYRLPIDDIQDISIQYLYRSVIDSYASKIDLLTTIGKEHFRYNSFRYYGVPSQADIDNAKFILYASEIDDELSAAKELNANDAKNAFLIAVNDYDFNCYVEISSRIAAGAMVDNTKNTILINKTWMGTETELNALIHHELGIHVVTTKNAELQPLKVFKLGLPENTHTQEGLAILSEYLSGNLTLSRLKILALRVIAVDMMINQYSFSRSFKKLVNDYQVTPDEAFKVIARIYRGGGFTKDFLYLRGIRDALHYLQKHDIKNLLIGKTSFQFLDVINELVSRNIVIPPKHLPRSFAMEKKNNPILDYLIGSIR
jgi:uncharacterized protein (TIGR02421 family)